MGQGLGREWGEQPDRPQRRVDLVEVSVDFVGCGLAHLPRGPI